MIGRSFLRAWPYALLAAVYLSSSPYYAGLNNPNEMARVYMSEAWVNEGHFQLDGVMRRWGFVGDEAKKDGHYYAGKAPLQSLVGGPALILSRATLGTLGIAATKRNLVFAIRLFGSTLFGLGFAMLLLWWLRRRAVELGAPEAAGTALGLSLGLGTMLLPYSITFTGHVLAAASAGMCALVAFALPRTRPGGARWRTLGVVAGFFGGACPFAEYPAALVAAPMLFAALWQTKAGKRAELLGFMALGGALPFGLGLWSHHVLWGSPFSTAYSFLGHSPYAPLVEGGFFGSKLPHIHQAFGALLSPETGLFFFSPVLLIGLFALIRAARGRSAQLRPLAWMSALAVFASFYFISAYPGWRGGWTLGPRYIISMAPLLGLWAGEALGTPAARAPLAATGVVSILVTGPAAVLYPHLSDVYRNPLKSFLLPFYSAGYAPYGLAHWAGLSGWGANAPVLSLFAIAAGFVGLAAVRSWRRRLLGLAGALGLWAAVIALSPERAGPAATENLRLARMWEPPHEAPPAQLGGWTVTRADRAGVHPCGPPAAGWCAYGKAPWQRFGRDSLRVGGQPLPLWLLHPIQGQTVTATLARPPEQARLVFGLSDGAARDNPAPLSVEIRQGDKLLHAASLLPGQGLQSVALSLSPTLPLSLSLKTRADGGRSFGFMLTSPSTRR